MSRRLAMTLLSSVLLGACTLDARVTKATMDPLTGIKADLAFTCAHEQIPEASADADVLFQYARWLQKNNQLKQDKTVDVEIERLYRIAAENGHYKANINLQNGAMRGRFQLRGDEHLRLSQQLIDAGVATGYFFVGIFLQQGSAGLKQDPEMALRYYRKAADQGSAEAQYYVGDKLAPSDIAPDVARQMRRCAAEQGHGKAADMLSLYLRDEQKYSEAIEVLQMGVAGGSSNAASRLSKGFLNPSPSDELYYLDQQEDLERADRYKKISKLLYGYSYANPKVPEINEILPLPPAKLPAWDGKLQWLEARLANVPPEKPSPALIKKLVEAKVLDPATGRPIPGSPAFSDTNFLGLTCLSGNPCPQTGYWKFHWSGRGHYLLMQRNDARHFERGEIMPTALVSFYRPRIWPLSDKYTERQYEVSWGLLG
ncbi:SEL1-like repeat protein [Pseudomonas laurylsulfatiphila]|uniref:SEL1-like repeat protein n=1 Tax=Pseudomonas laurylsulfatiphila TaxID=2011015 RepID=UPI003D1AA4B2